MPIEVDVTLLDLKICPVPVGDTVVTSAETRTASITQHGRVDVNDSASEVTVVLEESKTVGRICLHPQRLTAQT